ncbi:MAG: TonB family protein [Bacteroidetes bacterium]|nr:TonB family protein [Bacteroidota bacterium]
MRSLILLLALLSVTSYAQTTKKGTIRVKKAPTAYPIYTIAEQMPEFLGGERAMMTFIQLNVRYPKSAVDSMQQGTAFVTFVVETDGSISNVRLLRGASGCLDCDKEAIRVVKTMPRWKPGMQSGNTVRVQFNIPIKFRLK